MIGGDTMLRALKSYWAFTNGIYKQVMLGLVPLVLIVGHIMINKDDIGGSLFFLFALFVIDTESDFFFMNGVYHKELGFPNFVQTSSKYMRFIRAVTVVDIVRRLLVYQIPFVMEFIYAIGDEERMQWCHLNAFWPWLAAFVAQCVVFVARHLLEWIKVHLAMTIGFVVMMILFVVVRELFAGNVMLNGFFLIVFLMISMVTVWYTEKKGKERYYD